LGIVLRSSAVKFALHPSFLGKEVDGIDGSAALIVVSWCLSRATVPGSVRAY